MKFINKGYKWLKLSDFYKSTPDLETKAASEMFPGFEGLWCKLIMSVTAFATTEKSVALVYGPLNCNWAIRNFKTTDYALFYGNAFIHMPTVNMNQQMIVSGGLDRLIESLIQVDKDYLPEIIGIFDSCSASLIGEDIQLAIKTAQKDCNAVLKYFPSAGLVSPWLGKSIEETAYEYLELIEKSNTINDSVNIIGQYKEKYCTGKKQNRCNADNYIDEATELAKYIECLDLKLHRVLITGGPNYIRTAGQASLNMISCPTWGYPLAFGMKEKFDIPFGKHAIPIGFNATSKWINELGQLSGRVAQAKKLINSEYNANYELINSTMKLTEGRTALIECGRNTQTSFARAMALGRFCEELGMKPYFFNAHPLEVKAKRHDVNYFLSDDFNPEILFGSYPYQKPVNIADVLESLNLNDDEYIYFTEDVFPFAKSGFFEPGSVPTVETGVHLRRIKGATSRGMGYSGAVSLLKQVNNAFKTAKRKTKPTLYARVNGNFFEFKK